MATASVETANVENFFIIRTFGFPSREERRDAKAALSGRGKSERAGFSYLLVLLSVKCSG
jgi:hypothetical protein